jgi:AcrR family transcriptional regulator
VTTQRRQPKQERSRQRVERIMAAAEQIIEESGDEGLTIRAVAERCGMPVATIYRYFADRDEICAAFLGREMEKIDHAIASAFRERETVSLRTMVTTSMLAHLRHHRENPGAVGLWFGAPRGPVVEDYVRRMDARMATWMRTAVESTGMLRDDTPPYRHELFIRLADRALEYILRSDLSEDEQNMTTYMFCDAIASYFERFATPAGLEGVPAADFVSALGEHPVHFGAGTVEAERPS